MRNNVTCKFKNKNLSFKILIFISIIYIHVCWYFKNAHIHYYYMGMKPLFLLCTSKALIFYQTLHIYLVQYQWAILLVAICSEIMCYLLEKAN